MKMLQSSNSGSHGVSYQKMPYRSSISYNIYITISSIFLITMYFIKVAKFESLFICIFMIIFL